MLFEFCKGIVRNFFLGISFQQSIIVSKNDNTLIPAG